MPAERWGVVMGTCTAGLLSFEKWYSAVVRWLKKGAVYDRESHVWVKRTSLEAFRAYRAADQKALDELVGEKPWLVGLPMRARRK